MPVLIDLLRLTQLGIDVGGAYESRVVALERLSDQQLGADWFAWVSWYAESGIVPPPDYQRFKGRVLARLDPATARFLGDQPAAIRVEELLWGGPGVDGVRVLDAPRRQPAAEAGFPDDEPVLALVHGGEAVAYPLRVLGWHELVNDRIGDEPVIIVYCGLCGSLGAFLPGERRFGTAGLVYRGGLLMYDRETDSLWSQLDAAPLLGPAVTADAALVGLPAVVTSLGAWRKRPPETQVLAVDDADAPYAQGDPYGRYRSGGESAFPVPREPEEGATPPKTRVFGVAASGTARAWPLEALLAAGVLEDEFGEASVALVATGGNVRAVRVDPRLGEVAYPAGAAVRAYAIAKPHRFEAGAQPGTLRDGAGTSWRVHEDALVSEQGERAPRLAGTLAYWFAWRSAHMDTSLFVPPTLPRGGTG